jgi:Gpi18-like mannosyltransferase
LAFVALTSGAGYDLMSYAIQAQSVLTHHNVYTFTDRYPYPPVWIWLVALAQWAAHSSGLAFDKLVRFPGIAGDTLTVVLLQRYKGEKAARFYALNPVSIFITAGHGQFDGLVMALVVAAWALWDTRPRQGTVWAALALGGAIALKGYPVLLLPGLLSGDASRGQRALLMGLAVTPLLVCVLIYSAFFGVDPAMATHVLGYQGSPIFGWSLFIKKLLPPLTQVLGWPARIAVLLFPLGLLARKPEWALTSHWLATFLGFYILAPAVSPQYLLWVLPLLAVVDLKRGFLYTAVATAALLLVYLWGFPEALPWGPALTAIVPPDIFVWGYWTTNCIWWLGCLWLFSRMFRKEGLSSGLGRCPRGGKAARGPQA